MELSLIIFLSYLMGSIPFGFILTKIFLKKDIREIGSGNIGATNVLRTGNKMIGYITLSLDVLKAIIPLIFIKFSHPEFLFISALSIFLGHVFPLWLKFKGGKGVATYLGVITAISIQLSLIFIFTWIVVSLIFKYSSLSSMFSALTVFVVNLTKETIFSSDIIPISIEVPDSKTLFIFFILIIFTHRKNIINLKNKTENKIKI